MSAGLVGFIVSFPYVTELIEIVSSFSLSPLAQTNANRQKEHNADQPIHWRDQPVRSRKDLDMAIENEREEKGIFHLSNPILI